MQNLTFLFTVLFLFTESTFSQTKRIAFRSHGGKAKEFTVKEEGNMGQISHVRYYNYPDHSEDYKLQVRLDSLAKVEHDSLMRVNAIRDSLEQMRIRQEQETPQPLDKPVRVVAEAESTYVAGAPEAEEAPFAATYAVSVFPNPFSEMTAVQFSIGERKQTRVTIYDLSGQKAAELCNGTLEAGNYHLTWNGSGIAQGVYLVHIIIAGESFTTKVVRQ